MKTRYNRRIVHLAGVAVGAAAVQALHAQAKLPAYVDCGRSMWRTSSLLTGSTCRGGESSCRWRRQIHRSRRPDCDFSASRPNRALP